MTHHLHTRALGTNLSRRGFLAASGGTLAAFLAGCGGGQGVGSRPQSGGGAEFTGKYDGPPVTLDYWNGFTGGDGPTMQAMLKMASPLRLAWKADFTPAVWEPGIYDGSRYGIPLDVHSLAMYWNKEHFDKAGITEAPTDAASLEEACQKLQDAGYKNPFWMPGQWPAHLMFFSLIWQNGGEPYNEDGSEATFGEDAGVAALTWMREQVDKGYSPSNVDRDAQYLAFKNGENSITWDGIWQVNDLNAAKMDYGMAPIPTIGDQEAVWANSHHFFMTAQAADDENLANASKVFIASLSQESGTWAEAAMIPARNSAREVPSYTEAPLSVLDPYLPNFHFLPSVPGVADTIAQTVEVAVNEAILGKSSVQEALSKYQENATSLLQQNKEKFGS